MAQLSAESYTLLHRLRELGTPKCFARLVYRILSLPIPTRQYLDHVEYFAGQQEITNAYNRSGYRARSFEYLRDEARSKVAERKTQTHKSHLNACVCHSLFQEASRNRCTMEDVMFALHFVQVGQNMLSNLGFVNAVYMACLVKDCVSPQT